MSLLNGLRVKYFEMEYKNSVYFAARDGEIGSLTVLLSLKSRHEISELVSVHTDGATPLIMACKNGHSIVVQYLLDRCDANVEQVGSVTIEDETVEGASPLWCAAAAGHLNIVKMLIKHKASVNSTTETMSTPLRAACYDGHYEVVKYLIEHGADIEIGNKHGHTSLMIACYRGHYTISKYLLECGADVNRKSVKGNTALLDSAESGNLEILKMLLRYGAKMDADVSGVTPLLCAALYGHSSIVEYFIEHHECTILQIINTLELLGATIVDKKSDLMTALEYWKFAMSLRKDSEFQLEKPSINSPIGTEVHTLNQLTDLISEPEEMRMQALLIRERILGPNHPDTLYYLKARGATSAGLGNFELCIRLWKYALDVQQQNQEPLSVTTLGTFQAFSELFCCIMSDSLNTNYIASPVVLFRDILHVFNRAIFEIENVRKHPGQEDLTVSSGYSRIITFALHLLGLMCLLKPKLNQGEEIILMRAACEFVHLNIRTLSGRTPLHLACYEYPINFEHNTVLTFPSLEVTSLLLEVGAYPNAMDKARNTPLHIVALNTPFPVAIFNLLLSHGAHLDIRNSNQQTPLQLVCNEPLLNIYPLKHLNLQCLCAQVITTYGISYRGKVHKQLCEFLDSH